MTGTSIPAVIDVHMEYSTSTPIDFTVFTDVCTINGDDFSTAAARTASRVRSLNTLIAGTPYRLSKASDRMSLSDTTGTVRC